jgi:site-specific recombinase XerD
MEGGGPLWPYLQAQIQHDDVFRGYFRKGDVRGPLPGLTLLKDGRTVRASRECKQRYHLYLTAAPVKPEPEIGDETWDALAPIFEKTSQNWLRAKPNTRRGYRPALMLISRVLGPHRVSKSVPAIRELIHRKTFGDPSKGIPPAPGSARGLRTLLGMMCDTARGLGWIETNPIRDIPKPKSQNKTGWHTLTETQIAQWRQAFPDYASDARAVFEIGLSLGARAGDLLRLGWSNIEDGWITFTPEKTRTTTGAVVHLPIRNDHLKAVLAARSKTDVFFFQKAPPGFNQYTAGRVVALNPEPWSYTRLQKSWGEWRAAAGLGEECVIHSMRKAFATRMANAGASLTDIADALGDTPESAKVYIAARDKRMGAARGVNAVSSAA